MALEPDQAVADEAPWSDTLTDYDLAHLVVYLRLLDAREDGASWQEAAKVILGRSPPDPTAQRCWESHMLRADWMTRQGYRELLSRGL